MKFKFNTYNEDYIMIHRWDILVMLAHLELIKANNKNENELFNSFIHIQNSIINYERKQMKNNNYNTIIVDIAINKNSNVGKYLLTNQKKPEYITIEEIIHSLLICIKRNEWQYYDTIANLIKTYGQVVAKQEEKNNFSINYEKFKTAIGEEVTNYIINSKLYDTKTYNIDKNVYLYINHKIIKTELPAPIKTTSKSKTKTIN